LMMDSLIHVHQVTIVIEDKNRLGKNILFLRFSLF